jgi:TatD DNase family protein
VPKLIHWYSCERYLEDYLEQGCYFTVGPDYESNPAVQAVLRSVPLDRVMTETDGLDALAWALNRPVAADEIEKALRGELRAVAAVHGISEAVAARQICDNLDRFLS